MGRKTSAFLVLVALCAAPAAPAAAATSNEPLEAGQEIIAAFEERFGFKSIFWCAEALPAIDARLAEAGSAAPVLPAIAFDASAYCLARHLPTRSPEECDQSVDAVQRLDVLYPGFSQDETARAVLDACRVFLLR